MGQIEELVIVGAGPAGLAAAEAARTLDPLVLEAGRQPSERDHEHPVSVAQGVGGAGLYSDGKFSFWPSASSLWRLRTGPLHHAYRWFTDQLAMVGSDVPRMLPRRPARSDPHIHEKRYVSIYLPLSSRLGLIDHLAGNVRRLRVDSMVRQFSRAGERWIVHLADGATVDTKRLLLATGRLGPLLAARSIPSGWLRMRRLEAGVRIEQPSATFFLNTNPQLDPKFIWRDKAGRVEWRTFCCCRQGTVVTTSIEGLTSVSGRAECPPTGRSNVGFNVRILDRTLTARHWPHLERTARHLVAPPRQGLLEFVDDTEAGRLSPLNSVFGVNLAARLAQGLRLLMQCFPEQGLTDALLVGPSVEGVGMYPTHDDTLATMEPRLWVAGDIVGSFRGLTAALVSGHVAGQSITRDR